MPGAEITGLGWQEDITCLGMPLYAVNTHPVLLRSGQSPFTDLSTPWGWVATWQWDMGAGHVITEVNPIYVYTTAGIYTVTLTTTVGLSTYVKSKPGYITVTAPD